MNKFFLATDAYSFYNLEEDTPMFIKEDSTVKRLSEEADGVISHNIDNYTSSNESVDFNVYIVPDSMQLCFYSMRLDYEKSVGCDQDTWDFFMNFDNTVSPEQAEKSFLIMKQEMMDFLKEKGYNHIVNYEYKIMEDTDADFSLECVNTDMKKNWRMNLSEDFQSFVFLDEEENKAYNNEVIEQNKVPKQKTQPKATDLDIDLDEIPF